MTEKPGSTSISSKKLWIMFFINVIALASFEHVLMTVPPESVEVIHSNYLTFLFFFNTAYIGVNVAQKWVLK